MDIVGCDHSRRSGLPPPSPVNDPPPGLLRPSGVFRTPLPADMIRPPGLLRPRGVFRAALPVDLVQRDCE